jgi:hypothetical protein
MSPRKSISNPGKQWAFLAPSCNLTVAHLYPNPSPTRNTLTLPNTVVGARHKVKHLHLRSYGPFLEAEYFSNEVALVAAMWHM